MQKLSQDIYSYMVLREITTFGQVMERNSTPLVRVLERIIQRREEEMWENPTWNAHEDHYQSNPEVPADIAPPYIPEPIEET